MRELDLFVPVGKGQRALIAAPPGTGKTTLFREIGVSCARMQPDVELNIGLHTGAGYPDLAEKRGLPRSGRRSNERPLALADRYKKIELPQRERAAL